VGEEVFSFVIAILMGEKGKKKGGGEGGRKEGRSRGRWQNLLLGGFNLLPGFPFDEERKKGKRGGGEEQESTRATKMAGTKRHISLISFLEGEGEEREGGMKPPGLCLFFFFFGGKRKKRGRKGGKRREKGCAGDRS